LALAIESDERVLMATRPRSATRTCIAANTLSGRALDECGYSTDGSRRLRHLSGICTRSLRRRHHPCVPNPQQRLLMCDAWLPIRTAERAFRNRLSMGFGDRRSSVATIAPVRLHTKRRSCGGARPIHEWAAAHGRILAMVLHSFSAGMNNVLPASRDLHTFG